MKTSAVQTFAGTGLPRPSYTRESAPSGEVSWVHVDPLAIGTSGPAVELTVDLLLPRVQSSEIFVIIRLKDIYGYLPSALPDYEDLDQHVALTAQVQVAGDGIINAIKVLIPYAALPLNAGGLIEAEISAHLPNGDLCAHAFYPVELPEDVDRSPDLLTVITHTLVRIAKERGPLTREQVRRVRSLLRDRFQLDPVGDAFLRRILKVANQTEHSVDTLAEVIGFVVKKESHRLFVDLLYDASNVNPPEAGFIDKLLKRCHIHDHRAYGPKRLGPHYRTLNLAPGLPFDQVRAQYRRLIRAYHPDRVAHLAQGFVDFATQKTSELNLAYAHLEKALKMRVAEVEIDLDDLEPS